MTDKCSYCNERQDLNPQMQQWAEDIIATTLGRLKTLGICIKSEIRPRNNLQCTHRQNYCNIIGYMRHMLKDSCYLISARTKAEFVPQTNKQKRVFSLLKSSQNNA